MTMDSTISELMQDNSNVSPETNPMDTVQNNELIYGHTHNGVKCAVCPTAKRACDRAWFSAKQIEEWSGMSTKTLWRRLNELEECERISRLSDLVNVDIPTETGAVKTTSPSELPRQSLESTHIGRDSRLRFRQQVGEN